MVFHYLYRFGITAWRRKTTLVVAIALLIIITAGVHYSKTSPSDSLSDKEDESPAVVVQEIAHDNAEGVKFVENSNGRKMIRNSAGLTTDLNIESLGKLEQPSRDEIAARRASIQEYNDNTIVDREVEQQMGIPFVNLDPKKPYIPRQRLVHFDLKGAPLKVSYFKRIFPLLKTMGATGILLGAIMTYSLSADKIIIYIVHRIRRYVSI